MVVEVPGEDASQEEVDAWIESTLTAMEEQKERASAQGDIPTGSQPNPTPAFHEPV